MRFTEEQAVRSKATGAEGTVLRTLDLVMVQMVNGEQVMMSASQLEALPPPDLPSPPNEPVTTVMGVPFVSNIGPGHEVICTNKWWCTGQIGRVSDRQGGKVYVEWDKTLWNYAGQYDGFYPVDNFQHYHRSVMSDAA